jgi:hypothetical protein
MATEIYSAYVFYLETQIFLPHIFFFNMNLCLLFLEMWMNDIWI